MRLLSFLIAPSLIAGVLPVHFEPNVGQVKGRTEWMVRASGANVYITGPKIVFGDVHMRFVSASKTAKSRGEEPLGGYSNYFLGPTEKQWFSGIPQYARVRYADLYAGIDLVYHASGRNIEYDFELKAGANPGRIELAFDHVDNLRIDENGALVVNGLHQRKPRVVQDGREIGSEYRIVGRNRVRIVLGDVDRSRHLTIDPVLEFSTYLGGPGYDQVSSVKLDSSGNIVLGGMGQTPAAPTLNPFQQTDTAPQGAWVVKLTPDGSRVIFYSLIGATGAGSLDLDNNGSPIVAGSTSTSTLPLKNAFQTVCTPAPSCGWIAKLSADGRSLIYSTYLSGSTGSHALGNILVDPQGNAYALGLTQASDFPIKNALQPGKRGYQSSILAEFSASGGLLFSTYLGSSGIDSPQGLALAPDGSLIISITAGAADFPLQNPAQQSAFPGQFGIPVLVKMTPDGQSLIMSTYIGGENFVGGGGKVATDKSGNIYLSGRAFNSFFTLKNPYQSKWGSDSTGFLMKLDPSGKSIIYSTFFGGSGGGWFQDIAVDKDQNVYATGLATSSDFPVKDSLQPFLGGGVINSDVFLTKFATDGNKLMYSTLLGGSNEDWPSGVTVDATGAAYVVGFTESTNFPVKNGFQPRYGGGSADGFLAKISDSSSGAPSSPLQTAPSRLTFQYVQGGSSPAAQSVSVGGPEGFFITTSAAWISAIPSAPTPPENVQVTVDPSALVPGTYPGKVVLHPQSGAPVATIDVVVTVFGPVPTLTSIDPALVPIGSDDTLIALHGTGFTTTSTVYINGIAWTFSPVTLVSSSTLTLTFPKLYFAGAANYSITVQNPQSSQSNAIGLAVGQPPPTVAAVQNAASYVGPPIAPGEMLVIYGSNFGTQVNTQVLFDNVQATIVSISPAVVVATVPYLIPDPAKTSLAVAVDQIYSTPVTFAVAPSAPALFTANASGTGQAAALNGDFSYNSSSNPASAGSTIVLFGTGGGRLTNDALPLLSHMVSVTIGGINAQVAYAGIAPSEPVGLFQLNTVVPAGVLSGNAVVVVKVDDAVSAPVTVAIQ